MTTQAFVAGKALRQLEYGIKVDKATATLPQSATGHIFQIIGGRVLLTDLTGEVTVIIQAQATTLKPTSTPTVGTAVDLATTVDMNAKEVGCLLGITGLPSDAMVATNAGLGVVPYRKLVLPVGYLDLITVASSTGSIKWSLTYIPLDDGAYVVAV